MAKNGIFDFLFSSRHALAVCILLYLAIPLNTFLNSPYPGGVDVATHLFQIGLIASEGLTSWNHWWYAGHPLLDQYPPLSHLAGALISNLVGVENAYKIVFTLVFMLLPISFYLLLQEFDFREEQKAFALYFFSFCPVYSYYLQGGVFSAIFAIPFAILFLKFLIRALNAKDWIYPAALSSASLAIAALSHLFVPVATGLFGFVYFLSFRPSIQSLKRLAFIGSFSFCLVAFFWVPLAFNYSIRGPPTDLASMTISEIIMGTIAPFGRSFATYVNYVSLVSISLLAILLGLCIHRDLAEKKYQYLTFLSSSIFLIVIWIVFLPHGGQAGGKLPLLAPILFSLFISKHFSSQQSLLKYVSLMVLFLFIVSLLLVRSSYVSSHTYDLASWAATKTESRALFIPQGLGLLDPYDSKPNSDVFLYEVYLFPHYSEKEIYNGWFFEAEPRPEIQEIALACGDDRNIFERTSEISLFSRVIFGKLSQSCRWNFSPEKFCMVLQEGAVDSVFANSNFPDAVAFADSLSCLERAGSMGQLISYNVMGANPYVDGNLIYTKKSGAISIRINGPYNGNLTVRESYYPYWKAYADGQEVPIYKSEHSFLSIPLDLGAGSHELKLVYLPNKYYGALDALSLFAWLFMVIFILSPTISSKLSPRPGRLA